MSGKNSLNREVLEGLSYNTPFFIFSKDKIADNLNNFKKLFPGALINYAMKANFEPEVLRVVADEGCGFEVASKYELEFLKEIGVSPDKIIYGTSVKPASHIKDFFDYGVDRFAADSSSELEKIALVAPGAKVYIRVRVNDAGSVFKFSEKFGTEIGNVIPLMILARNLGLKTYGISFHVGSQAGNKMAWANAIHDLSYCLDKLEELGISLEVLNLGGGFPCNKYVSSDSDFDLSEIASLTLGSFNKLKVKPKIMLEPGRGVIADTGVAIASVIARIERPTSTWLFLDLGVYNGLFESMAYQGSTRYKITSLKTVGDSGEQTFSLAGPTGDSPDVLTKEVLLPSDIGVGDRLVIHDVGAYGLVATSRFNGFPHPDVYFV